MADHHAAGPAPAHRPRSQAQADFWHPTGSASEPKSLLMAHGRVSGTHRAGIPSLWLALAGS
ncbi:hypothetical protein FMEAI12_1160001 [Parafrankia sp. Ea1.12]|nr:hypothetical protein FMEAI12_1160001 [Parafrankia sp. Ea1.12]